MNDRQPGRKSDEVDAVELPPGSGAAATWALILAGPMTWFAHFMVVYLLVEALCTGATGRTLLGRPLATVLTLAATAVALVAVVAATRWAYRRWSRDRDETAGTGDRALSFAALTLGGLFTVAILYTGLPALWLPPC